MEAIKKLQLFQKFFWLDFGVKQIIDSLLYLFLFTHIGLNFNERIELIMKIYIYHVFFKNWTNQTKKKTLKKLFYILLLCPENKVYSFFLFMK